MVNTPAVVAQRRVREYHLTIADTTVHYGNKERTAIAVNGQIPAPTLYFEEGDSAVIHVTNKMEEETSVHWHGLLVPNLMDGVPYLSTPPIREGKTFVYHFVIRQTGTYWYHSHTMLQEQLGLYGSIVIHPRARKADAPEEQVLVLADWTNEKPMDILRNLKRGSEWYTVKKGNAQSFNRIIAHNNLKAKLKLSWQRMPGMDISDVYYDAFLVNGQRVQEYPLKAREQVRLRVINGSSSTYFHVQFAGGKMQLIAADGQEVEPFMVDRVLIGVAETYDFIVTVPEGGSYEFRATAQDGTGYSSTFLGTGPRVMAPDVPRPDIFKLNEMMANMSMGGMSKASMGQGGMMNTEKGMEGMDMKEHQKSGGKQPGQMQHEPMQQDTTHNMHRQQDTLKQPMQHQGQSMDSMQVKDAAPNMVMEKPGDDTLVIFDYDMLRAKQRTAFDKPEKVRELTFNLTGNMWRYIWSINGKILSEADKIKVDSGQVLRIKMVNQTMMRHPMHLHGHFFRVLNEQGAYSPLKHTVDVPPMQAITIEFLANEPGEWFFHCHILYHMMSGMARVFSYNDYRRNKLLGNYPLKFLLNETNPIFILGEATLASHRQELDLRLFNTRNSLNINAEVGGWYSNKGYEVNVDYARWLTDYFRVYAGGRFESHMGRQATKDSDVQEFGRSDNVGVVGVRYLLPLFVNADLSIDHTGQARLSLDGVWWLFPRTELFYYGDTEKEFMVGLEQILSRDFSLTGSYHSDYGIGGGLSFRF
ncbi:multicopper oxidase domain-containing protein [Pontibacter sp. 172403-2]|uniref:multicopper oxidase domain-containing protein n=1 Tax=Pontibacter rufus TaxID=2791028 RepID=UPI0018AFE3B1|nr:multicopper oxidase domain-containing protein [Pontibacter sp. 172403-2]MBF9252171.1 multicopper oxidase domain-containing protein [Pontibacter sp. 172403-2]